MDLSRSVPMPDGRLSKSRLLMILACPACSTRYKVDRAAIGPRGRTVKCAHCGHQWAQPAMAVKPEEDTPIDVRRIVSAAEVARGATKNLPISAVARQARYVSAAGWITLAVVISVLGATLWLGRAQLVDTWPAMARLYDAVGIEAEKIPVGTGLDIQGLTTRRVSDEATPLLVLEGEVLNVTDKSLPVPPITATLRDVANNVVQHLTFDVGVKALEPQERVSFETRFPNPPNAAADVEVFFEDLRHSK